MQCNYLKYNYLIFRTPLQILLLWREVAEDGAGNGFRDFVHV